MDGAHKQRNGISSVVKVVYHNPFLWALVKSVALFAVGVRVARECIGLDLTAPSAPQ